MTIFGPFLDHLYFRYNYDIGPFKILWDHFGPIYELFNLGLFMAFQNHYPELIGHSVEVLLPPTKEYKKTGCN